VLLRGEHCFDHGVIGLVDLHGELLFLCHYNEPLDPRSPPADHPVGNREHEERGHRRHEV